MSKKPKPNYKVMFDAEVTLLHEEYEKLKKLQIHNIRNSYVDKEGCLVLYDQTSETTLRKHELYVNELFRRVSYYHQKIGEEVQNDNNK